MTIAFYRWDETDQATRAKIMRRGQANIDAVVSEVMPIIIDVRDNGDDALRRYAQKFDGAKIENLKVSEAEFEAADKSLDESLKSAIQHCVRNVKTFHVEQTLITHKTACSLSEGLLRRGL